MVGICKKFSILLSNFRTGFQFITPPSKLSIFRMKSLVLSIILMLGCAVEANAQSDPPELSSWMRNTTGLTGYNSLPANVQQVRYSTNNVYINASGIPSYSIGPWPGNPNVPVNKNYVVKFPRTPAQQTSTKTATPLGPIGLFSNGVAIFNSLDANSYNNQGIWHQNAVVVEASGFDACHGHTAPGGFYHHHQNPLCLYVADPANHSPIVGYAFDGFGIYGHLGEDGQDLTNADLDECHGHTHLIEWAGQQVMMYHYHATWEFPYTVGCFRGTAVQFVSGAGQGGGGPQGQPGGGFPPPPPNGGGGFPPPPRP